MIFTVLLVFSIQMWLGSTAIIPQQPLQPSQQQPPQLQQQLQQPSFQFPFFTNGFSPLGTVSDLTRGFTGASTATYAALRPGILSLLDGLISNNIFSQGADNFLNTYLGIRGLPQAFGGTASRFAVNTADSLAEAGNHIGTAAADATKHFDKLGSQFGGMFRAPTNLFNQLTNGLNNGPNQPVPATTP